MNFKNSYSNQSLFHQFQESSYDFLSRHINRNGIYFYIDYQDDNNGIIFSDSLLTQRRGKKKITICNMSDVFSENLMDFKQNINQMPREIYVTAHDPSRQEINFSSLATVYATGLGRHEFYVGAVSSQKELDMISAVVAEAEYSKNFYYTSTGMFIGLHPGEIYEIDTDKTSSYLLKNHK
ncbi:hypothetical protein BGC07_16965 [Piscirickettsia litoralis]|uniref:Uncharacterized protein n=1 Tax=Piscirickettsia litoralis TaxID=1891921 RepID=A0ABX2ZXQ6_9GAMM|nr:hypothetical protein BGC07_16965 [Piscirickettsia litoralis]